MSNRTNSTNSGSWIVNNFDALSTSVWNYSAYICVASSLLQLLLLYYIEELYTFKPSAWKRAATPANILIAIIAFANGLQNLCGYLIDYTNDKVVYAFYNILSSFCNFTQWVSILYYSWKVRGTAIVEIVAPRIQFLAPILFGLFVLSEASLTAMFTAQSILPFDHPMQDPLTVWHNAITNVAVADLLLFDTTIVLCYLVYLCKLQCNSICSVDVARFKIIAVFGAWSEFILLLGQLSILIPSYVVFDYTNPGVCVALLISEAIAINPNTTYVFLQIWMKVALIKAKRNSTAHRVESIEKAKMTTKQVHSSSSSQSQNEHQSSSITRQQSSLLEKGSKK
ncbi:hypothetical protein BCR33DRAFT_57269 [Rhizoclosmatium globosum]|uniref:Uncharacterized protein n=1 Tax=Rhizoclosmatium globosum TaxID=329046 RepID=A0A1Y2CMD7_9FUNG|nr:hypothetical protein BCR33DRAFT_57269 [Rhizoclosmatium globosum]|eukprot:ORY48034.1 hypothetical protein BCR33DRAFT_57269 [Rhizoclosmatium globosum]